jgi:hypothetical protein
MAGGVLRGSGGVVSQLQRGDGGGYGEYLRQMGSDWLLLTSGRRRQVVRWRLHEGANEPERSAEKAGGPLRLARRANLGMVEPCGRSYSGEYSV